MNIKKGDIRALLAGIIMVMFILFFMDVHPPLTAFLSRPMAWFQFFPSLISTGSGSIKAIFPFTLLILLCLTFGRIYCALLCPLGIFQDAVIFLSRRYGRRPSKKHEKKSSAGKGIGKRVNPATPKGHPFLWYAVLILTTILFFAGSLLFINLLDPFSIFGRFCSQLFLPVSSCINNLLVSITEHFQLYVLSPVTPGTVLWPLFWLTYAWLILMVAMAFYHGRLYCNTLCPAGAFFSLLSRFSLLKFSINREQCSSCGKCRRICRAHCMDPINGWIDGARCVSCFDCMDICPEKAVEYTAASWFRISHTRRELSGARAPSVERVKANKPMEEPLFHGEKREFIHKLLVAGAGVMATALTLRWPLKRMAIAGPKLPAPVTPPGSLSFDHFSHTCLACQACISACPEKVLIADLTTNGMAGIMQPRLDFTRSRCAYTCNACTWVCPSGAILPLSLEKKQRTRIGNVKFERKKCLVYTHKRDCGACAEVCPTHAVHTVREKNIHHPRLKPGACIGCGACQLVCPVNPKAIYVVAAQVHDMASPPFFQKESREIPTGTMGLDDEFPF